MVQSPIANASRRQRFFGFLWRLEEGFTALRALPFAEGLAFGFAVGRLAPALGTACTEIARLVLAAGLGAALGARGLGPRLAAGLAAFTSWLLASGLDGRTAFPSAGGFAAGFAATADGVATGLVAGAPLPPWGWVTTGGAAASLPAGKSGGGGEGGRGAAVGAGALAAFFETRLVAALGMVKNRLADDGRGQDAPDTAGQWGYNLKDVNMARETLRLIRAHVPLLCGRCQDS